MPTTYIVNRESICIKENEFIIIEQKTDNTYIWNEVTYTKDNEKSFIGSFYPYDYLTTKEWLEYNSNYIAILAIYVSNNVLSGIQVKKLFDINSKQFVSGTQKELNECFKDNFRGHLKKKQRKANI